MSQRAFNAPRIVILLIASFVIIHLAIAAMGPAVLQYVLGTFAFIPVRYALFFEGKLPFEPELLWTPLTYGFLHGDLMHLVVNSFWLLVFGSPLAWRFGLKRFLLFSALCTVGAAALHGAFNALSVVPMVGASGAISGHTGAALRFAFSRPPRGGALAAPQLTYRQRALSIPEMMRNRTVALFFVFWLASNFMFAGAGSGVAWIAHIGGFLVGIFLFPLLDPVHPESEHLQYEDDTPTGDPGPWR